MIVTIHQPNFIPWMPFFEKIDQADVYVCLTHCQFEKNGFQNRFNHDGKWHTMSVKKGNVPIRKKKYIDAIENWEKIKKNLPNYEDFLSMFDHRISNNLMLTNLGIIKSVLYLRNIKTEVVLDWKTHLKSTERLVDICVQYGATKYLSGIGAKDYLDESLFEKENIEVIYQEPKNKVSLLDEVSRI